MSLKKRYKSYLILALVFCALGIGLNYTTGSPTGIGALFITTGGVSLVLGITIKKKSQDSNPQTDKEQSSPE